MFSKLFDAIILTIIFKNKIDNNTEQVFLLFMKNINIRIIHKRKDVFKKVNLFFPSIRQSCIFKLKPKSIMLLRYIYNDMIIYAHVIVNRY